MTEENEKRRPGRPATGHHPTRSVRIGPVWEEAMEVARQRREPLNQVITRALENYVRRHGRAGT
jgi:hypothetical protein